MSLLQYLDADRQSFLSVSLANPLPVTSGGAAASGTTASGNPTRTGAVFNTTLPIYTNGQIGDLQINSGGVLRVSPSTLAAAVADGATNTGAYFRNEAFSGGSGLVVYGSVFNGSTWDRVKKPNAVGRIVSAAASTNATVIKNTTGDLFMVAGYNAAAAVRYIKFYNKATAPTVGTDTPVLTLAVPPSAAFAFDFPSFLFTTGIGLALTTGAADADTGTLTAGDILGLNVVYQ